MADINIVQAHAMTPAQARSAAQTVADKISQEYALKCEWRGDVLHFERSGVNGELTLGATQAQIVIRLGFLMGAFRSAIEAKVAANMKKVFAR
jgi:putative polyhydroxyalkanoate system protein